jgi:hypothetical protein
MPALIPRQLALIALAAGAALDGAASAYVGGVNTILGTFFLLLISPLAVLAIAIAIATVNVVVRMSAAYGCLYASIQAVAIYSLIDANSSTASIGVAVVGLCGLLLALVFLLASAFCGRGPRKHGR